MTARPIAIATQAARRSFQVMFALQNAPLPALQAPELLLTPLELSSRTSKFDLTLFATEVPEGLRLTMEYSTDLFDAATVDRMLAHYRVLLEEIIAHPDQPIGALAHAHRGRADASARGMERHGDRRLRGGARWAGRTTSWTPCCTNFSPMEVATHE